MADGRADGAGRSRATEGALQSVVAARNVVIAEGVRALLADAAVEVAGVAQSLEEGLQQAAGLGAALLIVDALLVGAAPPGSDAAARCASGAVRLIVLSLDDEPAYVREAVALGAMAYLHGDITAARLQLAVEVARQGHFLIDRVSLRRLLEVPRRRLLQRVASPIPPLTPREAQVLLLVAEGLSNRQIARQLSVSTGTVRVYVSRILAKLELADRAEAARWVRTHVGDKDAGTRAG